MPQTPQYLRYNFFKMQDTFNQVQFNCVSGTFYLVENLLFTRLVLKRNRRSVPVYPVSSLSNSNSIKLAASNYQSIINQLVSPHLVGPHSVLRQYKSVKHQNDTEFTFWNVKHREAREHDDKHSAWSIDFYNYISKPRI